MANAGNVGGMAVVSITCGKNGLENLRPMDYMYSPWSECNFSHFMRCPVEYAMQLGNVGMAVVSTTYSTNLV